MASARFGSGVRHGYSRILRWKRSSSKFGSVRYQLWERLWVFGPRPWLARWEQKSSKRGYWEQLARRSRLKREGRLLMWIQRLLQSVWVDSMVEICWEDADLSANKRKQKKKMVDLQAIERGRGRERREGWRVQKLFCETWHRQLVFFYSFLQKLLGDSIGFSFLKIILFFKCVFSNSESGISFLFDVYERDLPTIIVGGKKQPLVETAPNKYGGVFATFLLDNPHWYFLHVKVIFFYLRNYFLRNKFLPVVSFKW